MGAEGTEGTEEDEGAFIHVVRWLGHHLIGYMALWGFGAKCRSG